MFAADNPFLPQARLAVRVLRQVAEEPSLALKGGTAINLFYRNLPRLSVDLDLVFTKVEDREASLRAIEAALRRIAPGEKDIRAAYENEFKDMTSEPVSPGHASGNSFATDTRTAPGAARETPRVPSFRQGARP